MAPIVSFGCALTVLAAGAATVVASPTLTLPLSRGAPVSGTVKAQNAKREVAHVQNKLRAAEANWRRNQKRSLPERDIHLEKRVTPSSGSADLTEFWVDFLDSSYYATVSVGTPAQSFMVVADSGSSDFWLASPGSIGVPNVFDPSTSTTFEDSLIPIEIPYGKGTFDGTIGTDTVSLAGFTTATSIVEYGVVDDEAFEFRQMSGIMGFAWSTIAASGSMTFMEQLVKAGALSSNVVSFHLGRGTDDLQPEQGFQNGTIKAGSITIGGTDSSTYTGDIEFFDIVQAAHWVIQADGMSVDGKLVSATSGVQAMMDTGTSLVVMPNASWSALADALDAKEDNTSGLLVADCSSELPTVALRIGGKDYNFAPEDLALGVIPINSSALAKAYDMKQGSIACLLPFAGGQESSELDETAPMIIFGDSFLKSWTSVFDVENAKVGLAAASPASPYTKVSDAVDFKLKQEGLTRASATSTGKGTSSTGSSSSSAARNLDSNAVGALALLAALGSVFLTL
ncbi:acid protease [Punctularia strigosozonata HHB-11173 SS5]|uniref:acid protease n=1 Tax=Punctularia strigosozonata (strain HHB-11173) TaxID=741275 RepID=UPI00044165E1|nr:acid protease [Punctularia strigosozonata HHB-11173 SS5]EIN12892.1 acid protease [Punctularia strigosozonata HHB-11173 SS5]